jgi:hypothetical protein
MVHQQSVNLDHSPQGECQSINNMLCMDHSPPGECLSTNTLTIHDAIYKHSLPTEEVISSFSTKGGYLQ